MTFRNGVVYTAGVGIGIDHKFGSSTASNITFQDMDIERLHGNSGGQATWLAVFVEEVGQGAGPIKDVFVKNVRARTQGSRNGFLQGYNASSMVSGVTISDVYMYANTTPATTLAQMNLLSTNFSEKIKIVNS